MAYGRSGLAGSLGGLRVLARTVAGTVLAKRVRITRQRSSPTTTTHNLIIPMTPPLVYLGLDVAKASLAGHLCGTGFELANDAAGHAALLAHIAAHGGAVHVICEATGGYERPVVAALRSAAVPVSVLHPTRARKLA